MGMITTEANKQARTKTQPPRAASAQPQPKTRIPFVFPSPTKMGPVLSAHGSCVMEDADDMDVQGPDSASESLTLPRDHPCIFEMVDAV